jgi:hypothetical protein
LLGWLPEGRHFGISLGWRSREYGIPPPDSGQQNVCRLIGQADGQIGFPTTQIAAKVHNATPGAVTFVDIPDVIALLARLNGAALPGGIPQRKRPPQFGGLALAIFGFLGLDG